MQQQLFEPMESAKKQRLVILKAGKKALTKNQEVFNKLTSKIEKLHREIEQKKLQFDTALKIYGSEIPPVEIRLNKNRRELIIILRDIYKSKKISKADQRHLKELLQHQLQELFTRMRDEPDDLLKKIFTELQGESYEAQLQKEKETVKFELQEMLDEWDLEMDLRDVDMDDEKAMAEKIAEATQKLKEKQERENEQFQQRKQKKKKTAKQVESERIQMAADELKQKNISTIYKQLAKLFHPDLEQDEVLRVEKEILMKELTNAYEEKNLHTLLTLELKWIHKENDHLETLSEEKLAIYLQVLKEQAKELEYEKYNLFQQPCYRVLAEEFGPAIQRSPVETVKEHLKDLQNTNVGLEQDLKGFQSSDALRYIKELIKDWKQIQRQINTIDEEFIRMMF